MRAFIIPLALLAFLASAATVGATFNGDTGDTGQLPDTGETGDTGELPDTGETGDTGELPDTGEVKDTGDGDGTVDTGKYHGAAGMAGEEGGCGCAAPGAAMGPWYMALACSLALSRRRRPFADQRLRSR